LAELNVAVRLDSIRQPIRKSLAIAAQLGASAVELNARTEIHPSQLSDTGLRQLRKMLDDLNLRVASLRFPTRRGYDNPQDLDRRVDGTKQAMNLAYRLGCPIVVNQIGRIPDSDSDPSWSGLQSVIDDLGRYGTRVGAFLAAETGAESGEKLESLLGTQDDGFIAVAFNPGQLIINRHSVQDALSALKQRIRIVCAVDGVLDLAAGRGIAVELGRGTADFPELIGKLEDVPFRGDYVVGRAESSVEELQQGIEYLKRL
jgi:sugar phosphate isomerase/epimerase